MEAYGISGKILKWIETFLSGRSQRVIIKGVLSDSLPVLSGVPQGSVLGPVLFLIFINDLLVGISSLGKLFADNAKIYREIKSQEDRNILQEDLNKLQEWSRTWLLQFNEDKCKVMHIGKKQQNYEYQLNNKVLEVTTVEKDLGIHVTPNMKVATHVSKVAAKANSMVGRIKHTFSYMDETMFKALYPSLVRSQMEYAVQAWSPQLQKDIVLLEKVQQRATKLVPRLKDSPYEVRKKELGLTSLVQRRARGDLIEVFKIMHGFENVDRKQFFKLQIEVDPNSGTRSHEWSIHPPHIKSKSRMDFFDIRIIKKWNSLPADVVRRQSLKSFKEKLDSLLLREEAAL